jgi:hypothetical protein
MCEVQRSVHKPVMSTIGDLMNMSNDRMRVGYNDAYIDNRSTEWQLFAVIIEIRGAI